jgi:hydrogenase expression/formation protein HypC
MCPALPAQIVDVSRLDEHRATVEVTGVRRGVNMGLLVDEDESLAVGGYWCTFGCAMAKMDEEEACATLELVAQMGSLDEELSQLDEP